ncbi:MAG TPA: ATP-binding protein [Burkholderiaceae bacterium]|nr:ATP-binding protein [Burkholderiaceae bacterium]
MGRLFWKVLLAFWLTLIVAGILVGLAVRVHEREVARDEPVVAFGPLAGGPRAEALASAGAATLRHGGVPALRSMLEEAGRPRIAPRLLAVDPQGNELLGRPVPAEALARARELVANGQPARGVRLAQDPAGQAWLLFTPLPAAVAERMAPGMRGAPRWAAQPAAHGPVRTPLSPLVAIGIGVLASLAFSALLAWYLARPIRHLRGAFAAVADGRLDTRVAPLMGRRADEVADLGRDFDRMTQRLQQLLDSQRRLLHDVSHELRSPLARLQAATGLVRQDPQRLEPVLDRIERETMRLDALVGELLALARLESGGAGVAARLRLETGIRDVHCESDGEFVVDADVELLHRALENVVRNAVKFTAEGTAVDITLRASADPGRIEIDVCDRGPGVAAGEADAIFEPFYRGGSAPGSGFGLGLAIARRAVELHGGTIRARNRDGGGLQVTITLPRSRVSASSRGGTD